MDLRVISTNHRYYQIDVEALCHILLELFPENVERIHPVPRQPGHPVALPATEYGVVMNPGGTGFCIRIKNDRTSTYFAGDPKDAPKDIPASVVDEYRILLGRQVSPAQREALAERDRQARMRMEDAVRRQNAMGLGRAVQPVPVNDVE
jgi:hypothetical protein